MWQLNATPTQLVVTLLHFALRRHTKTHDVTSRTAISRPSSGYKTALRVADAERGSACEWQHVTCSCLFIYAVSAVYVGCTFNSEE